MEKQDALLNMIYQLTEELDCIDEELITQWNTICQQYKELKEENYQLKTTLAMVVNERDKAIEKLEKSQQDSWLTKIKHYVKTNREHSAQENLTISRSFPNPLVNV